MRDFKGMKRQRGRNRKPGGGGGNANAANPNRSWDSQGPENIKVRGNAQTVYERYQQLARDASSAGDRVLAENYLQHAEHYFRVLRALQPNRPVSEIAARELAGQGYDIDFEDESGAQAAAFLAAQQAADRAAQQQNESREGEGQNRDGQQREGREWRERDGQGHQNRDGQNRDREWTPRPPRENRDNQNGQNGQDGQPRAESEQGEGGRRETRRERWERRREERNRRFEAEGGTPDTRTYEEAEGRNEGRTESGRDDNVRAGGDFIASTAPVSFTPPAKAAAETATPSEVERPARRTRAPRVEASEDTAQALPGFLTRSSAPAAAPAAEAGEEAAAPKRRAPRKKAEAPADGE